MIEKIYRVQMSANGMPNFSTAVEVADRPSIDKEYLTKLIQEAVYDGEACARLLDLVDRPQGWIPCSERLPEIGQKVLASTKKTVFTQVYKGIYSDPKRWAWENNSVKRIEAWQPLPKPWKGADDE